MTGAGAPGRAFIALWVHGLVLALFLAMLSRPPRMSANDTARWMTVSSLVERGTYEISLSTFGASIDYMYRDAAGERHYYASKPALMASWVGVVAWPLVALGMPLATVHDLETRATISVILLVVNLIPLGILVWCYWSFVQAHGIPPLYRGVCLATATLGTYLTGYAGTLNNHTFAAFAVFMSFFLYWRASRTGEPWRRRDLFAVGLWLGCALVHDVQSGVYALGFLVLGWTRAPRGRWLGILGFGLPVIAWLGCEYLAHGTVLPRQVSSALGLPGPTFQMADYWNHPQGRDAVFEPLAMRAWNMLGGHHGFFSLTPIFLVSVLGFGRVMRVGKASTRTEALTMAASFLVAFAFFLLRYQSYGGTCQGFRWLFWATPLFLFALPAGFGTPCMRSPWLKGLSVLLCLVSAGSVATAFFDPWSESWLSRLIGF